jgi:hypothetical protein
MEVSHESLHLDKRILVQWRIMDLATSFIWTAVFFDRAFEYCGDGIFRLLWWMQKLHPST